MKTDIKSIIIIVLIIGTVIGGTWLTNRNKRLVEEVRTEVNLKNALQDSINYYQNKEGEWVAEKLTLQADVKTLEDENLNLTENQKELMSKVKNLQKDKDVIAAALVEQEAMIEELSQFATDVEIDTGSQAHTVHFVMDSDSLKYQINVSNVTVLPELKPKLTIANLRIPNKQFVEFHWEDGKTTPVAFSVTNSNPLFITNNIDSYAIPELVKEEIDPTGWQKFKAWIKKNGERVGTFIVGGVVGGLIVAGAQ